MKIFLVVQIWELEECKCPETIKAFDNRKKAKNFLLPQKERLEKQRELNEKLDVFYVDWSKKNPRPVMSDRKAREDYYTKYEKMLKEFQVKNEWGKIFTYCPLLDIVEIELE